MRGRRPRGDQRADHRGKVVRTGPRAHGGPPLREPVPAPGWSRVLGPAVPLGRGPRRPCRGDEAVSRDSLGRCRLLGGRPRAGRPRRQAGVPGARLPRQPHAGRLGKARAARHRPGLLAHGDPQLPVQHEPPAAGDARLPPGDRGRGRALPLHLRLLQLPALRPDGERDVHRQPFPADRRSRAQVVAGRPGLLRHPAPPLRQRPRSRRGGSGRSPGSPSSRASSRSSSPATTRPAPSRPCRPPRTARTCI